MKKANLLLLFLIFILTKPFIHASNFFSSYPLSYSTSIEPTIFVFKPYSKNLRMLMPTQSKLGYSLGIQMGMQPSTHWIVNTEFAYQHADLSNSKRGSHHVKTNLFQALNVMFNGIYYFQPCNALKPYLGAGIGYRGSKITIYRYTLDYSLHSKGDFYDHAPAYQILGGIAYPLANTTDIALDGAVRHGIKKSLIIGFQLGLSIIHSF